ncbi:MAG: c-type cytochrome [Azoarcus sp.]|nr:c-type cytochrome [Azoarcus sp.]
MMPVRSIASLAVLAFATSAYADPKTDAEMLKLAAASGCLTCHSVEPGKKGPNGMAPIGPAWDDVAAQYAGKPGASEFLTRIVLEGSSPYSSHWKGKVSGLSMPPNAVAITEGNARRLVDWILAHGK